MNKNFDVNNAKKQKQVREAIKAHTQESKRQYEEVYEKNLEFIKTQMDTGNTDYSLYSLVLEKVSFHDCENSEQCLLKFYAAIFPYIGLLIRENYNAKALLSKIHAESPFGVEEFLSNADNEIFNNLMANKSDPLSMSHKVLNEQKEVAKKRAKSKILLPGQKGYVPPKGMR